MTFHRILIVVLVNVSLLLFCQAQNLAQENGNDYSIEQSEFVTDNNWLNEHVHQLTITSPYERADFTYVDVGAESLLTGGNNFVSGGLKELATSDDADLSIQRSMANTKPITEFELQAVSPVERPLVLEVTLEGAVFARSKVAQSIRLFDYAAGQWELVDNRGTTRFVDSTVTVTATGDLSRFVESKTRHMKARIRYEAVNQRQHFSSNTDQFIWTIGM